MSETVEIEIDESKIVAYLFDENDKEIGFEVEEDGSTKQYFYADNYEVDANKIREATKDLNEVYKDSAETIHELKEAFSDISKSLKDMKIK